jgi:two-component system sensor histidine kinase/response regulator
LSRPKRGKPNCPSTRQPLSGVVKNVEEKLKPSLKEKKQKIKFEGKEIESAFDAKQMERVLERLVHNASKFGDTESTIEIQQQDLDNKVILSVVNDGKPLSKDVIEKILKPFALDENIMNHSKGIGMGLSISQAILKLHGSHLDFVSEGKKVKVSFQLDK